MSYAINKRNKQLRKTSQIVIIKFSTRETPPSKKKEKIKKPIKLLMQSMWRYRDKGGQDREDDCAASFIVRFYWI